MRCADASLPSKAAKEPASRPIRSCSRSAFRHAGIEVVLTREPGGSPGAEIIRHIILSGAAKPLGAEAETMLFASARDDHLRTTIRPALERGAWVICDRFANSTRVYQGIVGEVDLRLIEELERITVGETVPDLLLCWMCRPKWEWSAPVSAAARRMQTGSRAKRWIFTKSCAPAFARWRRASPTVAC